MFGPTRGRFQDSSTTRSVLSYGTCAVSRYLDFLAGAGSLNYGHNNPVLKDALIAYIQGNSISHSLDLHTLAKESFLQAMRDIILVPRGYDYVVQFTGPTGANAVEAALKIARKVTGRCNVIYFTNSFHGVSMGALCTSAHYFRAAAGLALHGATPMSTWRMALALLWALVGALQNGAMAPIACGSPMSDLSSSQSACSRYPPPSPSA